MPAEKLGNLEENLSMHSRRSGWFFDVVLVGFYCRKTIKPQSNELTGSGTSLNFNKIR